MAAGRDRNVDIAKHGSVFEVREADVFKFDGAFYGGKLAPLVGGSLTLRVDDLENPRGACERALEFGDDKAFISWRPIPEVKSSEI